MIDFRAYWGNLYKVTKPSGRSRFGFIMLLVLVFSGIGPVASVHAWRWDEEEADTDETELQLQAYRKQVEGGMPLQVRIQALDRLIKLFEVRKRNSKILQDERAQLLADEKAIQTVSDLSRQKAQSLFQLAFEQVRLGNYRDAQTKLAEAGRLNPNDKIIADLRQKIDAIVRITPQAPLNEVTGDLVKKGMVQYLQNEPSKSLNFLLYAQQKDGSDKSLPALVDLVKQAFPNETSDILDARLNLIDQKLQRALEKIYSGEYLVAAKECQEVLDLEPENALALTRLGSVYYAMGQVKQARVFWQQALTLDAKNDVLKSFLQQSESEADRSPSQALTYKVSKGDTLQTIAQKIYKTPTAWRKLYNANRQYLKNAYTLTEGQVLVIRLDSDMVKLQLHRRGIVLATGLLIAVGSLVWAAFEKEQLSMERDLTQRIEAILSKTLSPNSYLVTVKVEMEEGRAGGVNRTVNTRGGNNPFLQKNRFVLPGVPEKKQFSTSPEVTEESTVVNPSSEATVRKISISILVAPDVTREQIRSLREFISSAVPFNPLRGDELDIQASALLKAATPGVLTPETAAAARSSGTFDKLLDRNSLPFLIVLGIVGLGLIGLAAFLFGPVRAFLNRLLAVLPRVGEQAVYAANANGGTGGAPGNAAQMAEQAYAAAQHHSSNNDTGPKLNMPFQFIREEQLSKVALLFREMASSEVALVLAYLQPAWASRLLSSLDAAMQSAVMKELSQGREVPAEVVNQVEAQIRDKLPYMVGGTAWIQDIFPLTKPQTQRVMLGTLAQQSPELAKALRQKTFFFEDLAILAPGALRTLVQETGYPQIAMCLKDEKKEFRDAVLSRLPAGIRDIVQQESELSGGDKRAIAEAKIKLIGTAVKLLAEGRITLNSAA